MVKKAITGGLSPKNEVMSVADIERHFTRPDGQYIFARWGRPIVPVVFGVSKDTLSIVKGAIEAVVALAAHKMAETDAELGANLMMFFFSDWDELLAVPKLDEMIPELGDVVERLKSGDASQYRAFRFENNGAIQACFVFIRMGGTMAEIPADTLALGQAVQAILLWSDAAFAKQSPLAVLPDGGAVILRPEIAALITVAYDPVMPQAANDKSHALRLFARMGAQNDT